VRRVLVRRLEQECVAAALVLERDLRELLGQREDDVEVGDVQEFGLALGEPLGARRGLALGAVAVAAGVVGDVLVAAAVARELVAA
jgi:hypothetical protein